MTWEQCVLQLKFLPLNKMYKKCLCYFFHLNKMYKKSFENMMSLHTKIK